MDNTKIIEQINKITKLTTGNKISWTSPNINLARWIKEDKGRTFTTTIQSMQMGGIVFPGQPTVIRRNNYVFTIQATNPNEVILQINTTQDPSFLEPLEALLKEAMKISKNTSVDAINKLLENL